METLSSHLDSLTDLELRRRVDMRPTLIRVLTDLYVQKLTHTPEEERHYTELALRLLEVVDVPTRAAVATRLARHLAPPARIMQVLAADLPEVTAPLRAPARTRPVAPQHSIAVPIIEAKPEPARLSQDREREQPAAAPQPTAADVAADLNEAFFAADAEERRLILRNLHLVIAPGAGHADIPHDPTIGRRLEAAALAQNREEIARQLMRVLRISREQAHRIVRDDLGEPIVVAAKALNIPRDLLYRILLFANTAVGHSVERVHALAELYDEMNAAAAFDLVAMWQAINAGGVSAARHQPLFSHDEARARAAAAPQRVATPRRLERRDAS